MERYSGSQEDRRKSPNAFVLNFFGHSGNLVGRGHKVEPAAMKVDGIDEVSFVTKAASGVFDPLNL